MLKIIRWLVWVLVSLLLVAGLDQTLIRVPMKVPVVEQFQDFYVDFRARLLGLAGKSMPQPSIEQVITTSEKKSSATAKKSSPRYLYADETGAIQFADSLDAVPPAFRKDAQQMER